MPDKELIETDSAYTANHVWKIPIGDKFYYVTGSQNIDDLIDSSTTVDTIPYWAALWPSAIVMAQQLENYIPFGIRLKVLELGCGLGLPGITAASNGALVTLTDKFEHSLKLAAANAELNNVNGLQYLLADWVETPTIGTFDVIIGSDILYERSLHIKLLKTIKKNLNPKGKLLLTDPGRAAGFEFIEMLRVQDWIVDYLLLQAQLDCVDYEILFFSVSKE